MNIIKNSFLILMVSSSLLLSGCDKISAMEYNKAENFSADIGVTGSESFAERKAHENDKASLDITEMKTIEPPEDGWTWDEIKKVIYINGDTYEYPLSLSELGDDFIATEINYPTENLVYTSSLIQYKGNDCFWASFEYEEGKELNRDTRIAAITFSEHSNESSDDLVSINGISLGSNTEQLYAALGYPDTMDKNLYTYLFGENTGILFSTNENNIQTIFLYWEE